MNDNYTKFEFEIQLLHKCHGSSGDSVYTVSVYKIYSKNNCKLYTKLGLFRKVSRSLELVNGT